MAHRYVALLRGINVGSAKRVAMADLRAAVLDLGYTDVLTVLNSGNVVFTAPDATATKAAVRLEEALAARLGVSARVIVFTHAELAAVVTGNPLSNVADNPSHLLVAFLADPEDLVQLKALTEQDWAPEALALGMRVAYLWCPQGTLASRLAQAVGRALGDAVTVRSWATVTRIMTIIDDGR